MLVSLTPSEGFLRQSSYHRRPDCTACNILSTTGSQSHVEITAQHHGHHWYASCYHFCRLDFVRNSRWWTDKTVEFSDRDLCACAWWRRCLCFCLPPVVDRQWQHTPSTYALQTPKPQDSKSWVFDLFSPWHLPYHLLELLSSLC
jgi:hypothetical protein